MYGSYMSCLMQSSLYMVIACNFSSGSCQVCLTSVGWKRRTVGSSVMRVIFIEDEETCVKIDLIEPRGHPLLASAERIPPPPSPPSCLDPLSQDTNTRSLIFTRGIFKLFLSFKLEILILPILIIQFSIFILLPVKQGRIGPPGSDGRKICMRTRKFLYEIFTNNRKEIFS